MRVVKTIKLYIGGAMVRSESGRSFVMNANDKEIQYARLCQASRKDLRNAIEVAKKGAAVWWQKSAFNRSQILYRMAEMCEGKKDEFNSLFQDALGLSAIEANSCVDKAIDTFVYYAGFCDKFQQLIGSVNPINGPYHNFTHPEAVGVVALIDSDEFNFAQLMDNICSILVGGNSVTVLLGKGCPAILAPLSEVLATSDLPAGVVNLLTGHLSELSEVIATHREIRSLSFQNRDNETFKKIKMAGVDNLKRVIPYHTNYCNLENILNFVEYKTVWHPIGI